MSRSYKFTLCFLLATIDVSSAYGPFPVKFIGNSFSIETYNNLTLCDSEVCIKDAQRLISYASYDSEINPCNSFKNFSCGTFFQDRALNERYEIVGFQQDYKLRNDEKRHKVLKAKINKKDGKAVKVLKNFYQKCIDWSEYKVH